MAANDYEAEVIRYFRRKGADGFTEPVSWIGAEQRFVNAIRNSGINNLEEQFLIGTNTYTEEYEDSEENLITETSFCVTNTDPTATTNYYKIKCTKYKSSSINADYAFDHDMLKLPNDPEIVDYGEGDESDILYCKDSSIFTTREGCLQIHPTMESLIQKDELFFIKDNGPIPVITKMIYIKYVQGKKITREHIVNHLIDS